MAPRVVASVLSLFPKRTDTENPLSWPVIVAPMIAEAWTSSRRTGSRIVVVGSIFAE
jgi:hypothetical protein